MAGDTKKEKKWPWDDDIAREEEIEIPKGDTDSGSSGPPTGIPGTFEKVNISEQEGIKKKF